MGARGRRPPGKLETGEIMQIRRVVTANDEEGRSLVRSDSEIGPVLRRRGFSVFPMWATRKLPAEVTDEDPNTWDFGTSIGGGSVFRLCLVEPGNEQRWHRTDTVDYAVVLSGEIDMQLDQQDTHLSAGDVLIQRGTNHNWVNNGEEPCVMLFVLLSTEDGCSVGW